MKSNQLIYLFAATLIIACSCNKANNSGHIADQQVFLTKYVVFSGDTSVIPYSTDYYYYDTLHRLQADVSYKYSYDPRGGAEPLPPDSLVYYYSNADSLPFKAVHYINGALTDQAEFYTYDNQARIIHRAWKTGVSESDFYYSYLANRITITTPYSSYDTLLYDGNNITQDINEANSNFPQQRDTFNIQSSGLQNPLYLLNVNRHIFYPSINESNGNFFLNKNAPLQVSNNAYDITVNYQYYNIVNGLPGESTSTYNSLPGFRQYFYYK
jgi:hypothetical protein